MPVADGIAEGECIPVIECIADTTCIPAIDCIELLVTFDDADDA